MRRIKLTVAYDGTNYCGWQVQNNGVSVQETLNKALSELFQEPVRTIGASRTDSGVHARGNVAVFDTDSAMAADRIAFALNTYLPEDIRIQGSEEVPPEFHPRFTETVKTYEYKILNRVFPDPLRRHDFFFRYGPLDEKEMDRAIRYLVGTHDFLSFTSEKEADENTVRTIYDARAWRTEDEVHIRITGNGFLYHMVRIIAGTLIEIGRGVMRAEEMKTVLDGKDRELAGPTAKAEGLTLLEIRYPEWEKREAGGEV